MRLRNIDWLAIDLFLGVGDENLWCRARGLSWREQVVQTPTTAIDLSRRDCLVFNITSIVQ